MLLVSARLSLLLILGAFFCAAVLQPRDSFAEDDNWTYNDEIYLSLDAQRPQPSKLVTKWCSEDGSQVVYTNLQPTEYEPCGELEIKSWCDAQGNKYLGRDNPPHGYLDCAIGPRIQIVNSGGTLYQARSYEPAKVDQASSYMHGLDALLERN